MLWHERHGVSSFLKDMLWLKASTPQFDQIPLLLIWIILWIARPKDDGTKWTDLALFVGIRSARTTYGLWSSSKLWSTFATSLLYGGITTLPVVLYLVISALRRSPKSPTSKSWPSIDCDKPLIHRCRTSHVRMFPQTHGFTLFNIDPSEYLERSCTVVTLQGRLEAYLRSQVWLQ